MDKVEYSNNFSKDFIVNMKHTNIKEEADEVHDEYDFSSAKDSNYDEGSQQGKKILESSAEIVCGEFVAVKDEIPLKSEDYEEEIKDGSLKVKIELCGKFIEDETIIEERCRNLTTAESCEVNTESESKKISDRSRIVELFKSGKNIQEISGITGITRRTVSKWIRRWKEDGNLQDRPRCGAPKKTSEQQDMQIIKAVTENPFTNAEEIKRSFNLGASAETVRKRLHMAGIHRRVSFVKERLNAEHRRNRLIFARRHIDEDIDFWGRVIFTGEKALSSTNRGHLYCWDKNFPKSAPASFLEEAQSGYITCDVWGWTNFHTLGEVASTEGRLTPEQYLEILEEVFLPSVRAYAFPHPEKIVFMHGDSPLHGSDLVQRWFTEQANVELLEWPIRAYDLNPMEIIWTKIVNCWNPEEEYLGEAIMQHTHKWWENLRANHDTIQRFIASMPERLCSVIDQNGRWTKMDRVLDIENFMNPPKDPK